MEKDPKKFGRGHFIGEVLSQNGPNSDFFDRPVEEQAELLGWFHGCPVTHELIDPQNLNPGRGPEAMLRRYAETNFWFNFIRNESREPNSDLYFSLGNPIVRKAHEPVGKHDLLSVAAKHLLEMSPMNTLAGYALPRVFIEQLGRSDEITKEEAQNRLARGLKILETVLPKARTPNDLLALLSEAVIEADTDPMSVLGHALSRGWLEEENAETMLQDLKQKLREKAPKLWQFYLGLSEEEKEENGIA